MKKIKFLMALAFIGLAVNVCAQPQLTIAPPTLLSVTRKSPTEVELRFTHSNAVASDLVCFRVRCVIDNGTTHWRLASPYRLAMSLDQATKTITYSYVWSRLDRWNDRVLTFAVAAYTEEGKSGDSNAITHVHVKEETPPLP